MEQRALKKQKQWKGINRKQLTRWQHLSRLKASAFFSLLKKISCYETQQLILGTGTAIWWVTEPHCMNTNIYSYLETSDGQFSNPYLNVVHFLNTRAD